MKGLYTFMMWLLSMRTWKAMLCVSFAKVWSMVMGGFGKPSPSVGAAEEEEEAEADTVHDDTEALLSDLAAVKGLGIEICVHSSHGQFIFRDLQDADRRRILAKTDERKMYFAVLDHISSSITMEVVIMILRIQDRRGLRRNRYVRSWNSLDACQQKELVNYVEAFWMVLAANQVLKDVHVYVGDLYGGDMNGTNEPPQEAGVEIARWISEVLSQNKTMLRLFLGFNDAVSIEAARILSMGLMVNQTLQYLQLSASIRGDAMNILVQPLRDNQNAVLEELFLNHPTDDDGVEQIAAMLMTNNSLKCISFTRINDGWVKNGIAKIGDALCINKSLQELECDWMTIHPEECQGLLKPLMEDAATKLQANKSLKTLILQGCKIGQVGLEYLITMILCNTSLTKLDVGEVDVFAGQWNGDEDEDKDQNLQKNVCLLLDSLKGHPSLKVLYLRHTTGVCGDKVLGTFMDLLLENNHIQHMDLFGTPLDASGSTQNIYTELEWRRKENSTHLMKDMVKAHVQSGRIFLCGDGEAGKTTLCTALKDIFAIREHSKMNHTQPSSSSEVKMEIQERTRGIEIHSLTYSDMDLTIWDMAGQEEYHSFHDLVIPNLSGAGSSCAFVLVCDPFRHTADEIRSRLRYWFQFIASNTRKSRLYRPHVTIVMTHYDLWQHEGPVFYDLIDEEVETLKAIFKDLLEFDVHRSFFPMDARQSNGIATELFECIIDQMKNLLTRLPKVLRASFELQTRVKDWNMKHPRQPFLSWDAFSCICEEVEELRSTPVDMELVRRRRKFVALALHDGGHIIYNDDIGFVIMNPHWFCHNVMGELLLQFHNLLHRSDWKVISEGFITRARFKRILSRLDALGNENHAYIEDFISIMMKLQICYDQGDGTLMVPSTLPASGEVLRWSPSEDAMSQNYVGRRLVPQDMQRTILSAGFFPRLQVYFRGKLKDDNTRKSYRLTKNTIFFIENGKEVFIEYDGHIDVMVRSTENKDMLLQFLHDEIFNVIYELLRNPTLGCPGVVLAECVVRPLCVKKLTRKEHRRDQFVLVESLKREVLKRYDLNYCHNWNDAGEGELEQGYDNARDLLGQKEWKDVLRKRGEGLKTIGTQVLSQLPVAAYFKDQSECEPREDASNNILSKLHSLKNIVVANHLTMKNIVVGNHLELKSMLEENRSIIQQQDELLYTISTSINEVMQFSVDLQKAQIPKLACLVTHTKSGKRQLLTRMIPGLTKCSLHFFCEHICGIHEVEDQAGYPVYFGTKDTKRVLCLIARGLQVATIVAKVAAHVGGGMGSLVPNLVQGASLVLDTPGLLDSQFANLSSLHILSQGLDKNQTIGDEDLKDTERWLIKKITSNRDEIYSMFKLNKVKYNRLLFGNGAKIPSIAWVCDKHKSDGLKVGMLESLSY